MHNHSTLPERLCSIHGCTQVRKTRGMCHNHYQVAWYHGTHTKAPVSSSRPLTPVIERFLDKICIQDTCWLWTGAPNAAGYAMLYMSPTNKPRVDYAHRFSYRLFIGPIPVGLDLDHLCRVRHCVNPDHLEPVTRKENIHRGLRGVLKTHCIRGHAFDEENTVLTSQGRQCRVCNKMRARKYWVDREKERAPIITRDYKRPSGLSTSKLY